MTELPAIPSQSPTPADPDALRNEIELVREDLSASIQRLREALDLRRILRGHSRAALAAVALTGVLVALGVRHVVRNARQRRRQRALLERGLRRPPWYALDRGA